MKVLFVCKSNVGRSQMAEALARAAGLDAFSAGFEVGSGEGQRVQERERARNVLLCMQEGEGLDMSEQVRKQLTEEMANGMDKIVVLIEGKNWPDYIRLNPKVEHWPIPDPAGASLEETRKVKNELKRLLFDLISRVDLEQK